MGRKPSNVYDFFERIEAGTDGNLTGRTKFECKSCKKVYSSNATKLAEHLRQSGCSPGFQSNQGNLSASGAKGEDSVDPALLNRLSNVTVCAIADALEQMKLQTMILDIPLIPTYANLHGSAEICGPAYTVQMLPARGPSIKKMPFHFADAAPRGSVIVVAAPEDTKCAVVGGLVATQAKIRGCSGLVTNARCRDVQNVTAIGFPVYSNGTAVLGRNGKLSMAGVGQVVVINGVVIRQNDIIRGDVNGVVVIPWDRATDVALRAEMIEQQDSKVEEALRTGDSLCHAIAKHRIKQN